MKVLDTLYGVDIVSDDRFAGEPYVEGHRISAYQLYRAVKQTSTESVLELYPYVREIEIQAVDSYFEKHPDELRYLQRCAADRSAYFDARRFRCSCGSLHPTFGDLENHIRHYTGRMPEEHDYDTAVFDGHIRCTCGEEFSTFGDFQTHQKCGDWPRDPHHIAKLRTHYTE